MPATPPTVFEPAPFGPLTLRNRLLKAATFEGRTPDALVTDELVEFHRRIAAGGIAMTTMAYVAVAPEGRTHREQVHLREEALPGLVRLTDAVHAEGAHVAAQVGHAGPVANGRSNGRHAIAPTAMPNPMSMQMVRRASSADLDRVLRDYVQGARLAVRAGFDALELHLGHGYLLSSFLSPLSNRRRDAYGGSLGNRAAYPRRVVRAVKEEVGDEVAVYAKLGMTDGVRGGLQVEEALDVASWLEADGCLDAMELSAGSSLLNPMYLFHGPVPLQEFAAAMPKPLSWGMARWGGRFLKEYPYKPAFLLDTAIRFRERLELPLVALGGLDTADAMTRAREAGFEFVALGRSLVRDPDLPRRFESGEARRSTCIHCNRCMPSIYSGTRCLLDDPEPLQITRQGAAS
ncbi:NADH:flavin oxidoreductase [Nocardioides marmoribigeumensis]|uniref:2,4-dienoyl-CoA reductase-like NADH-dependent reductase (Old Yellow Enzyme family) n=1 Tax=Nocardioides marmoribigeumensis TaxID=433649 RepID=A0ABU2BU24_9ACTN|nr:NADH:flavin oxidoreductase [Nocardioides marmoribigeumensis]MDR7361776.1 2,4-dienoyl-CoA reductase-like NADH-dependent reductase (Old Yellow Enzyme family) [Nocardioides marmoribigeumensis]